jgi:DNA-binding response OmpR family regulator
MWIIWREYGDLSNYHCPHCGIQIRPFEKMSLGNVCIAEFGCVTYNSQAVRLPPSLFLLAEALIRAQGRGLTRSVLANVVGRDVNDSTITKYIARLREVFCQYDPGFNQIECIKGFGAYRWVCGGLPPAQ